MIIDLVGPNCIGKTTLAKLIRERFTVKHIKLGGDTNYSTPRKWPNFHDIWRVISRSQLLDVCAYLIARHRFDLAMRILSFYDWQITSARWRFGVNIRDENLLKKLLEAMPFAVDGEVAAFWLDFIERFGGPLATISLDGADKIMFLTVDEKLYLERFRSRQFGDAVDGAVIARFRLQMRCQRAIVKSRAGDARLMTVDVSDQIHAVRQVMGGANREEWRAPICHTMPLARS